MYLYYVSIYLAIYSSIWLSVDLATCLSDYLTIHLSVSFFLFKDFSCLFISLSIYLSILLSESKQLCETSVKKWKLICPKRSNSAKLPQKLYFLSSKTKNFRETYSILIWQHETILREFLQKWQVECRADCRVPMCFAIFPFHLSKVLRLPRKREARSYEVLRLSRKIIFANLKIWCSKRQPFQEISARTS